MGHSHIATWDRKYYYCARCGNILWILEIRWSDWIDNPIHAKIILRENDCYADYLWGAYDPTIKWWRRKFKTFWEYAGYVLAPRDLYWIDENILNKINFIYNNNKMLPLGELYKKISKKTSYKKVK